MRSLSSLLLLALTLSLGAVTSLSAQPMKTAAPGRVSPHETISKKIDGNRVMIVYGRPYAKDPKSGTEREIWGTLVPFGKIWRTGSDEATLLLTQKAITFGTTVVPAGVYTLFTLPNADGSAKLVINKQVGQWGIDPYDAKQEFAQIDLTKEMLDAPVEQFTMAVDKKDGGGGVIKMMWAKTQYSAPFTVSK